MKYLIETILGGPCALLYTFGYISPERVARNDVVIMDLE